MSPTTTTRADVLVSLSDDVMVGAAFLANEADRLAEVAAHAPARDLSYHLAASVSFRARSERLFAHARDLARIEGRPQHQGAPR